MNNNKNKNFSYKKKKEFRLIGKELYLTYTQLDKNIKFIKEKVLKKLKDKLKNIKEYIIVEEKHQDGITRIHCFFELNVKIDISDSDYFDLIFNGKSYHGNYQIGKRKDAIINYLVKECNYITNMILPIEDDIIPLLTTKNGSSVLKNLPKLNSFNLSKKNKTVDIEKIFHVTDFYKLPSKTSKEITNWIIEGIKDGFSVTMVLYGPPGTGKIQLGRSIFNFMKIFYLEISKIQDFKKLDITKHRGILVDDVNFEPFIGTRFNILDSRAYKTIDTKYGLITTEEFIPRIIINNINTVDVDSKELERKIKKVIFIPEQISSKFDLHINIQNIRQNCYFGDNINISEERLDNMLIEFEKIKKLLK